MISALHYSVWVQGGLKHENILINDSAEIFEKCAEVGESRSAQTQSMPIKFLLDSP